MLPHGLVRNPPNNGGPAIDYTNDYEHRAFLVNPGLGYILKTA